MTPLPVLAAGDVYLYAHANGAVYLRYGDGRSMLVPLAEAVAVAQGCEAAGCRVVVGCDDAPPALDVVEQVRAAGVQVEVFGASEPPHSWSEGTDALIEAASVGTDRILDDLVERGADVHHRDASGSTALHHAAANGNVHAIDVLVRAGADIDAANERGFTPVQLARACREGAAADRLAELGADASTTPCGPGPVALGRGHLGVFAVWLVPVLFVPAVLAAWWPLTPWGAGAIAAFAVAVASVLPPRAFWAGGAPVQLDGTVLTIRSPFRGLRAVDLADVTVAAIGGSTGRGARLGARWLLLGHPAGTPVDRRTLRRLLVPPDELDAIASRVDRILVVAISGGRTHEVIGPVGDLLSSQGVDLSTTLRRQLVQARSRPS